jgi:hypothetical protein
VIDESALIAGLAKSVETAKRKQNGGPKAAVWIGLRYVVLI